MVFKGPPPGQGSNCSQAGYFPKEKRLGSTGRLFRGGAQLWLARVTKKSESIHSGTQGHQDLCCPSEGDGWQGWLQIYFKSLLPKWLSEGPGNAKWRLTSTVGKQSVALLAPHVAMPRSMPTRRGHTWFAGSEVNLFFHFVGAFTWSAAFRGWVSNNLGGAMLLNY